MLERQVCMGVDLKSVNIAIIKCFKFIKSWLFNGISLQK
jgi:hypothetical protein